MGKLWIAFFFTMSLLMRCGVEFSFGIQWVMPNFSLILLEELVGETHFKYLEFGTSLSNVVNLVGMQQPYFWKWCETSWANQDFVWLVSNLGFYALYFHFFIFNILLEYFWFVCNCYLYFVFIIMNMKYLFYQ